MIEQIAIAIAFPGFNDLGRTVTPVFLSMDHFLYQFSALSEKVKKIYRLEVWIFCKMPDGILFFIRRRNTRYKNPQLVAQYCFVASFGRCFPFFTVRNQLDPQNLIRNRNICCRSKKCSALIG